MTVFFGVGIFVGSLLVESSSSLNESSSSSTLTRSMLNSVDANSVSSVVSVRGKHLRKVEDAVAEQGPISIGQPVNPFRDPHMEHNTPPIPVVPDESQQDKKKPGISASSFRSMFPGAVQSGNNDRAYSLHAVDQGYLTLPATLDADEVLIAAWIYLDDSEANDKDMRTIFSNKQPGCEAAEDQQGLSLFVNAWQTSDHALYVEYGGSKSGCNKLDSGSVRLNKKIWYHVAVYLSRDRAMLFINGEIVNQMTSLSDAHIVSHQPMFVGRYSIASPYSFYGNISTLAVVHLAASSESSDLTETVRALQVIHTAKTVAGLRALYPLEDAAYEKPNSIAHDISQNAGGLSHAGKYTFSSFGSGVAGVSIPLLDGVGGREVTAEMKAQSDKEGYVRREKVKEGMQHAWRGYKKYAWGRDELKPLSNHGQDNWGGMGVTLVDSLDTLWVMGLKTEFAEAQNWVAQSLSFDHAGQVSVFETTIRELGGLLSAYDLSGSKVFLDKAKQLGDRLIHAFSASRTGIPSAMLNMRNNAPANGWAGPTAILSELGTLQVEFRYLAYATSTPSYEQISMKPVQLMAKKNPPFGLYPIKVRMDDGGFADSTVTFGALGDSFYEYLLKLWLQGGRKETWLREAYDRAMNGAINKLLMSSSPSGLAFFSDWNGHSNFRKMDHLVCFVPGMLALGAYTDPLGLESGRAQRDLAVAKALMYTCREMYHRMRSGISAEYVEFPEGRDLVAGSSAGFYILRPETAESLFILNQLTGDPIYRDWAWEIWEAIDKHCKTPTGYASLRDVQSAHSGQDDRMESFFLAETMKYLYLAQDPDKPIDLMEYVFNTEAHPMRIFDADKHKPVPSE